MIRKIETTTGLCWIEALCRTREFSEYLLYGYFVHSEAPLRGHVHHEPTLSTGCISYWDQFKLDKAALTRLLGAATASDFAFSAASFSETPPATIREVIDLQRGRDRNASSKLRESPRDLARDDDRTGEHQPDRKRPLGGPSTAGRLHFHAATSRAAPNTASIFSGIGFASVVSTFLAGGWFRNLILSEHARDNGADIRGVVLHGYLLCCLTAPAAYGLGRLVGLDAAPALAAVSLAIAVGLFELTQDLARARLRALTALKGTLARATSSLCLGVGRSPSSLPKDRSCQAPRRSPALLR